MKGDVVPLGKFEAKSWSKGTFEVHVEFYLRKVEEERVGHRMTLELPGLESGVGNWWFHCSKIFEIVLCERSGISSRT